MENKKNKNMLWIVCKFDKKSTLDIEFNLWEQFAIEQGFSGVDFVIVSKQKYMTNEEIETIKNLNLDNVHVQVYSDQTTENQCIFNASLLKDAFRYFVCDAHYFSYPDLLIDMVYRSSFHNTHFVRCQKTYEGVFVGFVRIFKKAADAITKIFANTKTNSFRRNIVVYSDQVQMWIKIAPHRSALFRETNYLTYTNEYVVSVDRTIKASHHETPNWHTFLVGSASMFLFLHLLVCFAFLSNSFNSFMWLLTGVIAFGVLGAFSLTYAFINRKTIFYRPFTKKVNEQPIIMYSKNLKQETLKNRLEDNFDEQDKVDFQKDNVADKEQNIFASENIKENKQNIENKDKKQTTKKTATQKDKTTKSSSTSSKASGAKTSGAKSKGAKTSENKTSTAKLASSSAKTSGTKKTATKEKEEKEVSTKSKTAKTSEAKTSEAKPKTAKTSEAKAKAKTSSTKKSEAKDDIKVQTSKASGKEDSSKVSSSKESVSKTRSKTSTTKTKSKSGIESGKTKKSATKE